jgi:subfamily B ATP-binding cassette protein HlyB/CyaB
MIGAQSIKAAAVEPMMRREWDERLGAYVRTGFDVTLIAATGQGLIQLINKCVMALILLFGAYAVMDNLISVGALVAFNMIAGQIAQPVLRLSQLWQDFQQVSISFERLGDILNARPENQNATMSALPPPKGAIEFKTVSFRYTPKGQDVLKRISFSIAPGETIGLVGPSGSGKSSIAKLMQRFYEPQDGNVLIDGLDLGQVDPAWLRRNIGVVLQENLLFARSIHENIALSQPSMPRAQVMAIAELAGAHEFIIKLPLGYDTMIEERGVNLSGGQRQRIAIARALATNPRILIFDEATSALDYESELIIQNNMMRIAKGRTVILIAHRLATLRKANRIFALKDGEIVESGTHDELLGLEGGLYARLWSMQSGGANA